MSNENVLIQGENVGLGQIVIANSVVHHIVMIAVDESEYVFLDEPVKKSLSIKNAGGHLNIDLKVRIQYGKDVERTCAKLQEDLQRNIELMIDYADTIINITVVGFKLK